MTKSTRPLNIWLEGTHLYSKQGRLKTGIGYFTFSVIAALLQQDKTNRYTVFGSLFFTSQLPREFAGARYRFIRVLPGKVWNQLIKKRLLPPLRPVLGGRPDVAVFFNYVWLPLSARVKTITVIYDLAFRHHPQHIDAKNLQYLRQFVPRSLRKSDHIVTISEHAKRDIVEQYHISADKISVIPCAVDHKRFAPTKLTAAQRRRYHLPERYLLFVGTLEPRKNVVGLLTAYEQLREPLRAQYPLVLAGGSGWADEEIAAAVRRAEQVGQIVRTGYVDEKDLAAIYSNAAVFVYPSHYEGFGLPVLEAMACGVPVITANNSSLPEAAGDAALLIDSHDPAALAGAIERILSDRQLAADLRRRGLKRAAQLSWDDSAHQLRQLIAQVAAGSDSNDGVNS